MRVLPLVFLAALACSCTEPAPPPPASVWSPGVMYPSEPTTFRGHLDVRGLIHAHSVFSHDACDGEPIDDAGVRDPVCFEDFRRGLCQTKHDFVFLTDHRDSFNDIEFPEALLFREELGDSLIKHDGLPTANLAACDDGRTTLIMAGSEAGMMPVGLEKHAATNRMMQNHALLKPGTPKVDMRLTAIGYLIPIKAHSFHEIMVSARANGLDYTDGCYAPLEPLSAPELDAIGPVPDPPGPLV